MMKFLSKSLHLFLIVLSIAACNRLALENRVQAADRYAASHGFKKETIKGGNFYFTTFQRISNPATSYNIYIEGDGLAFLDRRTISENPTPTKVMLLELAKLDPRENVVYLARPCQFSAPQVNPQCLNHKYWSSDRFSEESVSAMNEAIKKIAGLNSINLIGFSGGGAIVTLVAARNPKVSSVITIAGNLDHVAFNNHHKVSQMHNSLNPIDYAPNIKNIPQLHLSGSNDTRVPSFIANKYVTASSSSCVKEKIINGATHESGWSKTWPSILKEPLRCE
jgi:alpha/beta hydrolase fold